GDSGSDEPGPSSRAYHGHECALASLHEPVKVCFAEKHELVSHARNIPTSGFWTIPRKKLQASCCIASQNPVFLRAADPAIAVQYIFRDDRRLPADCSLCTGLFFYISRYEARRKMEAGDCGPTPYQPLDSSFGGTGKRDARSGSSSCSSSSNASVDGSGPLTGGRHGLNGSDGSPVPLIRNTSKNGRSHHFDVSSESGGGSDGGGGVKTMG
ncbi:unnamed protein product, partial [Ectocarpus fasciculatus]